MIKQNITAYSGSSSAHILGLGLRGSIWKRSYTLSMEYLAA